MSSFRDRFGSLTVAQALELNAAVKWLRDNDGVVEDGSAN